MLIETPENYKLTIGETEITFFREVAVTSAVGDGGIFVARVARRGNGGCKQPSPQRGRYIISTRKYDVGDQL